MSDGLNINGINIDTLKNLEGVEIKKEELSKKDQEIFSVFAGVGKEKLDNTELAYIFQKLIEADSNKDGTVTKKELKKADIADDLKDRGVKSKDIMKFANKLLPMVNSNIKKEQTRLDAEKKKAELDGYRKFFDDFVLPKNSEEFKQLLSPYTFLKAELEKDNPDLDKVEKLKTSLEETAKSIEAKKQEKAQKAAQEAAQLEEKRKNNVQSRPEMDPALRARRSYSDSTNRIGGKAWKNNVGANFREGEGKLNIADYTSATQVLDALLATESYNDLKLSGKAKEALLKDFIHNNKSMFNGDGKIHKNANVSKMELPKKSDIEKARYGEPAANIEKEPKPLFTKDVQDIITDMAKNKMDGSSKYLNDGWYQISWDDKDMAISYRKLDKGVYCVDLNHPDDVNEVYYSGKIDLNGDKTKMSDVELSILENVITIISEPINRAEKHKVI